MKHPRLLDEVGERAIELFSRGHTHGTVADALGIHRRTLYMWESAADDDPEASDALKDYVRRARQARGSVTMRLEAIVFEAIDKGDAQLALKVLQIRCPEDWRETSQSEVRIEPMSAEEQFVLFMQGNIERHLAEKERAGAAA